jgi:TRAP transporter TAXI family solute receptor
MINLQQQRGLTMSVIRTLTNRTKPVATALAATLLSGAVAAQGIPSNAQLPTGSTGGGFYYVGGIIGNLLENNIDGLSVSVMPSQGSGENLNLIQNGEVSLALMGANSMYPAWSGTGDFEGRQMQDFRILMHLYPNATVFVALENSGLSHMNQLEGERVAVGSAPIPWDAITGPFLEAHGVDYPDGIDVVYAGLGDGFAGVGDGRIDAAIGTANNAGVQQLASQRDVSFLEWDESARDELVAAAPYRNKIDVPASDLPGLDSGVYSTVDMGGPYLVAHKDISDEFAYEIVKVLNENIEEMAEQVGEFSYIRDNPAMRALPLGEAKFHPGAQRYWAEQGLWNR